MTFQALLFCPDEKIARVTTQVLTELEFSVEPCSEPFAAVKKLMGQHFDAVVVDCENEQNATLLFKSARNSSSNQGSLAVAVVEGQAGVASAFRIGANLVLTKPINVEQAKSTLRVARGLLRKGADASKSPSAPAPAPAAVPAAATAKPPRPIVAPPVAAQPVTPPTAIATRPVPQPAPIQSRPSLTAEAASAKNQVAPSAAEVQPPAAPVPSNVPPPVAARAASAQTKPAAAKTDFPFQPLTHSDSAPSGAGKIPISTPSKPATSVSPSASGKVPIFQAKPVLRSGVGIGQGGAASAPAPAKEHPSPLAPGFNEPSTARRSQDATQKVAKVESSFAAPAPASSAAVSAPTFAALDAGEGLEGSGKSKVAIIAIVLALALAAAGYFGYTKFYAKKTAQPAPPPQSEPSSTEPVPVSSTATPSAPQASALPESAAASSPKHEAAVAPHQSSETSDSAENSEPEVVVTHPTQQALAVRADVSTRKKQSSQVASADISAPPVPVLGNGQSTEPSALSEIVQSAPVAMPKVATPQTLRVSQGVTEGLLIKKVPPAYPRHAIQMRLQGVVQLQAIIDRQGRISSVKVVKGDPVLARAAVEAVNQWRYKPYFLDGQPVDIETQITITFKLP